MAFVRLKNGEIWIQISKRVESSDVDMGVKWWSYHSLFLVNGNGRAKSVLLLCVSE